MVAQRRVSGVLLPVFSLRSRDDFGIGDFGALPAFFRWMEAARQKLLMVLPLLPTQPGDSSPYATRSAFGLNPLFIDLYQVQEFTESGGFGALTDGERRQLDEARAAPRIKYGLVFPLKAAALRRAFDRFDQQHGQGQTERGRELLHYNEERKDWLHPFALFAALSHEQQYRPWWEWPQPLRDREGAALAEAQARLAREIRFHCWQQWVAETQWAQLRREASRLGILLCGDEPFIVGQDSADTWAQPALLRRDARLGVPPDAFSATGQDWGLPYFDFAAMEAQDFAWLKFRARWSAEYYDLRRVDHAVGYFRQWIRDERTPTGRFVPPEEAAHRALGEKIFRLLSERAAVIAEDLGVIPTFVREILARLHIPGYRVLRWERDESVYRNPRQFPAASVVTTGTHDTETLREWWESLPEHEREAVAKAQVELRDAGPLGGELKPLVHEALLTAAQTAASDLCILPWQDILGTRDRINLPGSISDANWSYRIEQPVNDLLVNPQTRAAAERMARLSELGKR